MTLTVGSSGTIMPPVDGLIRNAQRLEEKGYDAIWWPDHLMGWFPQAIWTPDVTPLAAFQQNPDVYLDPVACISAVGVHTQRVRLGTSVTEPIRRHPAMLANEWLSLSHLSKGRAILGIGCGEAENIVPYGLDYSNAVSKFEEALAIIRLLWENDEPVDFDGTYWPLRDAVVGLGAYDGRFPPIWVGAHGPRMLDITGRFADGWLPTHTAEPADYAERLGRIRDAAKNAGRDPDAIEAGLWDYTIVAADHEEAHRIAAQPLPKVNLLVLPSSAYERLGHRHPLGDGFYGIRDFIPARYTKDEVLKALDAIPEDVVHAYTVHGTPDELTARLRQYESAGLQHAVLWNQTFLGDPTKVSESFHLLDDVLAAVTG
ncbi:MAG: LLM class flavin-dependent oxidoreductase [Actinomycetota bacterium]